MEYGAGLPGFFGALEPTLAQKVPKLIPTFWACFKGVGGGKTRFLGRFTANLLPNNFEIF